MPRVRIPSLTPRFCKDLRKAHPLIPEVKSGSHSVLKKGNSCRSPKLLRRKMKAGCRRSWLALHLDDLVEGLPCGGVS
jgi:hypothetical protein